MSLRLTDRDHGYKKVMRATSGSRQGRRLRVGVHGDEEIMAIAAYQEFGTATIPERSFIRSWFDENRDRINRDLRQVGKSMLRGEERDGLLAELGHRYRDEVQARMLRGIGPELSPNTIKQKASRGDPSTPLITQGGRLLSSIVAMLDEEIV